MASMQDVAALLPASPREKVERESETTSSEEEGAFSMPRDGALSTAIGLTDREPKLLGAGMKVLVSTNKRNTTGAVSSYIGQSAVVVGNSSNCLGGWIHLIPMEGPLRKFKLQRNSLQFQKLHDPAASRRLEEWMASDQSRAGDSPGRSKSRQLPDTGIVARKRPRRDTDTARNVLKKLQKSSPQPSTDEEPFVFRPRPVRDTAPPPLTSPRKSGGAFRRRMGLPALHAYAQERMAVTHPSRIPEAKLRDRCTQHFLSQDDIPEEDIVDLLLAVRRALQAE